MSNYNEISADEERSLLARISVLSSLIMGSDLTKQDRPTHGEYERVTNFGTKDYSQYKEAIERYKLLSDAPKELKIGLSSGHMKGGYGLWIRTIGPQYLSVFWRIFREIEGN